MAEISAESWEFAPIFQEIAANISLS